MILNLSELHTVTAFAQLERK